MHIKNVPVLVINILWLPKITELHIFLYLHHTSNQLRKFKTLNKIYSCLFKVFKLKKKTRDRMILSHIRRTQPNHALDGQPHDNSKST